MANTTTPPSPEDAFRGAAIVLANADALSDASEVLASSGFYGPATSLVVLATEELTKAAMLLANGLAVPVSDKLLLKMLRDHRYRHAFAGIGRILTMAARDLSETEVHPEREIPVDELIRDVLPSLRPDWFFAPDAPTPDGIDDEVTWWGEANRLKQRGFYVDHTEGRWEGPESITAEVYKSARRIAMTYLTSVRDLMRPWLTEPREDRVRLMAAIIKAAVSAAGDGGNDLPDWVSQQVKKLAELTEHR